MPGELGQLTLREFEDVIAEVDRINEQLKTAG